MSVDTRSPFAEFNTTLSHLVELKVKKKMQQRELESKEKLQAQKIASDEAIADARNQNALNVQKQKALDDQNLARLQKTLNEDLTKFKSDEEMRVYADKVSKDMQKVIVDTYSKITVENLQGAWKTVDTALSGGVKGFTIADKTINSLNKLVASTLAFNLINGNIDLEKGSADLEDKVAALLATSLAGGNFDGEEVKDTVNGKSPVVENDEGEFIVKNKTFTAKAWEWLKKRGKEILNLTEDFIEQYTNIPGEDQGGVGAWIDQWKDRAGVH